MLKPQVHRSQSIKTQFPFSKPFLHGNRHAFLPAQSIPSFTKAPKIRIGYSRSNIKAVATTYSTDTSTKVKAVVTVKPTVGDALPKNSADIVIFENILLELVSAELDPNTGEEKSTINCVAKNKGMDKKGQTIYEAELNVPQSFGNVGAVLVQNQDRKEIYLKDIVLDGFPTGSVNITCNSWVQPMSDPLRIFFTDMSYLPSQTPDGLTNLRAQELLNLRGNGEGERQFTDRIYDYDVYNDLGDPDASPELARPVLGGVDHPYPRRCRTGRPHCKTDPASETRSSTNYVPRDENFSGIKQATFSAKTLYSVLHGLLPDIESVVTDEQGFPYFTAIDTLFNQGIKLPSNEQEEYFEKILPRLVKPIVELSEHVLKFETPETIDRDQFFWLRDEEFGRETLSGLNPCSIQLVTEWPLKSSLDPAIYGPPESAITTELVEKEIGGVMTVDEALEQKKLFILDYNDLLIPYVEKVRQLEGTTLYGSRTLFFLNEDGTLRPLAIELTRPPMDGLPQWKQVFSPSWHSTKCWLWRLAKAQVLAHDSGYHQLISHWLRTHCCTEPYVIATNRQLSAMHPINRLLQPHLRYTMEINALARENLINAGGTIETTFSPLKYSMEISSDAYDQLWRFDYQALPNDLISRGIAVEDSSSSFGLKLTIEDYPYANDGLDIWFALKQWVSEYVHHYYSDLSLIESDTELQAWWNEIRTVGHADKKDESWWPVLKTPKDLIEIITTIVWVASGHHAAVNFGQYEYAGYFPNRPTITRTNMPTEEPVSEEDLKLFLEKPQDSLLKCFPTQLQATKVMAVLDVLSTHSPDEEYLGKQMEPAWGEDPVIKAAFEKFRSRMIKLEGIIDERNKNMKLRNRNGAGMVPYELLKPFSRHGVTEKGVPYSISI